MPKTGALSASRIIRRVEKKSVFVVIDQVRHKRDCTDTEDGWRLQISDLEKRRIVLPT